MVDEIKRKLSEIQLRNGGSMHNVSVEMKVALGGLIKTIVMKSPQITSTDDEEFIVCSYCKASLSDLKGVRELGRDAEL